MNFLLKVPFFCVLLLDRVSELPELGEHGSMTRNVSPLCWLVKRDFQFMDYEVHIVHIYRGVYPLVNVYITIEKHHF